jgi:hypothetical protein
MTAYLLIGLCFSLMESQGRRPSISLVLLWPMAVAAISGSVVLGDEL